jgi:hypothetical protein
MRTLTVLISTGLLVACGVVGSPVPPEYVGVAPTVEKQKKQHALQAEREAVDTGTASWNPMTLSGRTYF